MRETIREVLIDERFFGGVNTEMTTDTGGICEDCENQRAMCVQGSDGAVYAFYVILAEQ